MDKKEKSLEHAMEELNQILAKMETGDTSLEESFSLYEKGMKLLKYCNDSIDKVEKKLIVLKEDGETDGV